MGMQAQAEQLTNKAIADQQVLLKRIAEVVYGVLVDEVNAPEGSVREKVMQDAFEAADDLPTELWYAFHLASHWYNDLVVWCEAVKQGTAGEMFE